MLAQDKPANVLSRTNRHNLFTFSADVIKFDCFNCTSSTSALHGCDLELAPYLKSRDNMSLSDALWDTILILLGCKKISQKLRWYCTKCLLTLNEYELWISAKIPTLHTTCNLCYNVDILEILSAMNSSTMKDFRKISINISPFRKKSFQRSQQSWTVFTTNCSHSVISKTVYLTQFPQLWASTASKVI